MIPRRNLEIGPTLWNVPVLEHLSYGGIDSSPVATMPDGPPKAAGGSSGTLRSVRAASVNWTEANMDRSNDLREIERKIAQANRAASLISDQTTRGRLSGWIDELKQLLRRHSEGRRNKEAVRRRAQELWEIEGRPAGRDLEFWLKAESEINDAS